jgi:SAM-dependent methyltransferase
MSQRRPETSYFTCAGNPLEMARIKRQAAVISDAAGGTLPGFEQVSGSIHDVLDVACGTGEWALRLARQYPTMRVTGIDISTLMVHYAQAQAESEHLPNTFQVVDILKMPLDFPDASFDLVNIRLIFSFMKREQWPLLLQECARLLRPGGRIRITESDIVLSNDVKMRVYTQWWAEAFHAAGNTFAVREDGHTDIACPYYGVALEMRRLLQEAHYTKVYRRSFDVDFSYDPDDRGKYDAIMNDLALSFQTGADFLMKYVPRLKPKAIADAREYVQEVLGAGKPEFQGYWHLVTTTGRQLG